MTNIPSLDDELLRSVRSLRPVAPADVISPTGPPAQRVLSRVTAAEAATHDGRKHHRRPRTSDSAARWSPRLTRRAAAAAVLCSVIAAAVVALVAAVSGGGASVVARAYAATDPAGMIVHYVETSHSSRDPRRIVATTEIWTYGNQSHQVLDGDDPKNRQDILANGGQVQTLAFGTLVNLPGWPAGTQCSAPLVLEGDCVLSENNSPIAALRVLLRSGRIRTVGHSTLDGRRLDVLAGESHNLRLRALIDARTFLPVNVSMVESFPQGRGKQPVTYALTITNYQRLPVTPGNLQRLALPAHPHARVIHMHPCPIKANPRRVCSPTTPRNHNAADQPASTD